MTGARYERELVDRLDASGWAALRIPTSGAGTARDLPDVLAGRSDGATLAIELKSGQDTTLYVGREEVAALERFADAFGATAYLGARFTTQASPTATYLVAPDDARETDAAYGLPVADIEKRASHAIQIEAD